MRPIDPSEPIPFREVVGQILKDPDGKLYFQSSISEPFSDDPVLVVRVVDYQRAIQDAMAAGVEVGAKRKSKPGEKPAS